jgi:hypothetical protein
MGYICDFNSFSFNKTSSKSRSKFVPIVSELTHLAGSSSQPLTV